MPASLDSSSARLRAALLVIALASIGGTGCAVLAAAGEVKNGYTQLKFEHERSVRMAALDRRVARGDMDALTEQAAYWLMYQDSTPAQVTGALAKLERAAAAGNGHAQALLGDILLPGRTFEWRNPRLATDPPRGARLLMQASTQACTYQSYEQTRWYKVTPTKLLADFYEGQGDLAQSMLWQARGVLHCGEPDARTLAIDTIRRVPGLPLREREMALLLLTEAPAEIARAADKVGPATLAGAQEQAAALRERVARSEQQYPAPPRPIKQ